MQVLVIMFLFFLSAFSESAPGLMSFSVEESIRSGFMSGSTQIAA